MLSSVVATRFWEFSGLCNCVWSSRIYLFWAAERCSSRGSQLSVRLCREEMLFSSRWRSLRRTWLVRLGAWGTERETLSEDEDQHLWTCPSITVSCFSPAVFSQQQQVSVSLLKHTGNKRLPLTWFQTVNVILGTKNITNNLFLMDGAVEYLFYIILHWFRYI